MPLNRSGSKAAISQNIRTEMNHGKPQKQAIAIAMNVKRKKMARGGPVQGTMEHRNEPSVPLHKTSAPQGAMSMPGKGDVWPHGKAGNRDLEASKERSPMGPAQQACEHGSEYAICPHCNDAGNEAPGKYAFGGQVDLNTDIQEEQDTYEDGHDLAMAEEIMRRRAREDGPYDHDNGLLNYAQGGPIPEQGTMTGHAGQDDDDEAQDGSPAKNAQRDGRMRPNNQELDSNGLMPNNNSDFEDDDFLSQDGEGSLFTGNPMDNEKDDPSYMEDAHYAMGGYVDGGYVDHEQSEMKEEDEHMRKMKRMHKAMRR